MKHHRRRFTPILYITIASCLLVSSFLLTALILKALTPQHVVVSATPKPQAKKRETLSQPVRLSPPVRLAIAKIGVSSVVKPVGLTTEGNMAIDGNINEVAWYEPGPIPGEEGSAVIAGHYGWKSGQPAIFNDLHTLVIGDTISTYDAGGKQISFSVQKIQTYNPSADATDVFQSHDGKAHLNLITCEGSWNSAQQTYSERLVIFTDKVG